MATSPSAAQSEIHMINAATKQELKLIKKSGFYKVNGDVIIGDLYRDPIDLHVAILVVFRKVALEDINAQISLETVAPATQNPAT